jgi:ABC-2 type transport system ATP-binding protein
VAVIDEPWVGLDPRNIRRVKDYLRRRAHDDGLTVFMSTHTLALAEELADRVGIIHRGKLLCLGSVAEIKALARRPGSLEDVFLELTDGDEARGGNLGEAGDITGDTGDSSAEPATALRSR